MGGATHRGAAARVAGSEMVIVATGGQPMPRAVRFVAERKPRDRPGNSIGRVAQLTVPRRREAATWAAAPAHMTGAVNVPAQRPR